MTRIKFRFLRPLSYLLIGCLILLIIWSTASDDFYAKLRMKMSQSAPSIETQYDGDDLQSDYLKEVQASGAVLPANGEMFATLTCEEIGLDAPLYYGDDDDILLKGVGQYPSGTIPGMGDTYLIAGHDSSYFGCLADVEVGDTIQLSVGMLEYEYSVTATRVMDVDDFVLEQTDDDTERIILYTCYPIGDSDSSRTRRLFVYCEMK